MFQGFGLELQKISTQSSEPVKHSPNADLPHGIVIMAIALLNPKIIIDQIWRFIQFFHIDYMI